MGSALNTSLYGVLYTSILPCTEGTYAHLLSENPPFKDNAGMGELIISTGLASGPKASLYLFSFNDISCAPFMLKVALYNGVLIIMVSCCMSDVPRSGFLYISAGMVVSTTSF